MHDKGPGEKAILAPCTSCRCAIEDTAERKGGEFLSEEARNRYMSKKKNQKIRTKVINNTRASQRSRGVDPFPGPRDKKKRTSMIEQQQKPKK